MKKKNQNQPNQDRQNGKEILRLKAKNYHLQKLLEEVQLKIVLKNSNKSKMNWKQCLPIWNKTLKLWRSNLKLRILMMISEVKEVKEEPKEVKKEPKVIKKEVKKEPKDTKESSTKKPKKKETKPSKSRRKSTETKKTKKELEAEKVAKNDNLTEQEKLLQKFKGPFVRVDGTVEDPYWTNVVNNTTDSLDRSEEQDPDLDQITKVAGFGYTLTTLSKNYNPKNFDE